MEHSQLQKQIIEEFSGEKVQRKYIQKAEEGLSRVENELINACFLKKGATIIDMGCGTGKSKEIYFACKK